jgi:hypothetical protein
MKKILSFCGMFIGGWVGWALGMRIGLFSAFVVSMIGTGAGLYAALRVTHHFLD